MPILTEKNFFRTFRFFLRCAVFLAVPAFTGCLKSLAPLPICPGQADIRQSSDILNSQSQAVRPIRASAHCLIEFLDPDGRKRRESFDAQLRFVPPEKLYIGGDKFGPIRFGSNEQMFWVYVKPGMDAAFWGYRKDAQLCAERFGLNPSHLTEALGLVGLDEGWILAHENGIDVLTKTGSTGVVEKRLYVDCCKYRIKRIEYFDESGECVAAVDLAGYRPLDDNFYVPADIGLYHYTNGKTDSLLRIKLSAIAVFEPTQAQLTGKLFQCPSTRGFKQVYRLSENCEFVPDTLQENQ